MKQFQFTSHAGRASLVRNFEEATSGMVAYDRGYMAEIPVGGKLQLQHGDWTRLPDMVDVEMEAYAQQTERLERIATAALQGLLAAPMAVNDKPRNAVAYAKALIAELDKQA